MIACSLCSTYGRPGRHEATVGVSCAACLGLLDADLVQLVTLVSALPDALSPLRSKLGGGGSFHQKPGPRLPVQLDALSLLGPGSRNGHRDGALPPGFLLREWATAWALMRSFAGGEREYQLTDDGRIFLPVAGVPALSAYLRARITWAAEHQTDFPRFAKEVHICVAAVRRITGEVTGLDARPIGWCPTATDDEGTMCLAPLSASAWQNVIQCPACSTKFDRARGDWDRLTQLLRDNRLTRR